MEYAQLSNFTEIAILFSPSFKHFVQKIYEDCTSMFPDKRVYLVNSSDVLCSAKCDRYESYILVGIECPLHKFNNSIQYKIEMPEVYKKVVDEFEGVKYIDSIYLLDSACSENISDTISAFKGGNFNILSPEPESVIINRENEDDCILVITESQEILDFFCNNFENIICPCTSIKMSSKVSYLMKSYAKGAKLLNKRMIGVIFTSAMFEQAANAVCDQLNIESRAYKIFLKDTSYERLISIDNLDCIVLVDCPLFQCNIPLHIPVVTPFALQCANLESASEDKTCKDLVVKSQAQEIMISRIDRAVVFKNDEEDMQIHEGKRGIASVYENEAF